ncbi:DNA damage-inducible protein 1, partial [Coemansia sp. RSA 1824]
MHLTINHGTSSFIIEVDESMKLSDLRVLLEAECNIPIDKQALEHASISVNGPDKSLGELGLKAVDALRIYDSTQPMAPPQSKHSTSPQPAVALPPRPGHSLSPQSPNGLSPQLEAHRQQVLANPQLMQQLAQTHPEIAEAARSNPRDFGRLLTQLREQQHEAARRQQQEMERLNADPFNLEAQQRIEEMIRQENIMRNMEAALEHNPESFASVAMLYIDVVVNGTPIKALVDSGAQATVMSRSCAESCGITRLIDTRFAGEARGVGRAKIQGRVHNAQMKLGAQMLMCSFTVMEGAHIGLLFGLDMLKRHQMCIDLKQNALVIGDECIQFLPEHLIPKADQEDPVPPMAATPSTASPTSAVSPTGTGPARPAMPQQAPRHSEDTIKLVMDLGVSREQAVHYLDAAGGDVNAAASMIF